jgi:hypothetical protein
MKFLLILLAGSLMAQSADEQAVREVVRKYVDAGKRTITVESVRFLAPGVALADARYEIGDRKMWTTLLITKEKSGWRIAAIRNMLPAK